MCLKYSEHRAQNILTSLDSIFNLIGWGSIDHLMSTRIFTLTMKETLVGTQKLGVHVKANGYGHVLDNLITILQY